MTTQDEKLLLQDLCARLPYGVIVKMGEYSDYKVVGINLADEHPIKLLITSRDDNTIVSVYAKLFKPYLRPMSSITEKEKEEIKPLFSKFTDESGKRVLVVRQNKMALYQDWLNAHHFDFRGLIPRGLAIEVTKKNNPYK